MKTKASKVTDLKDQVILHVLNYLEDNDEEMKAKAIQKLQDFAKCFNVPTRRHCEEIDTMTSLKQFIDNSKGYITTIPNLYKSLIYGQIQ